MVLQLQAEKRTIFGKALQESRQNGKLPVIIYGTKEKAAPYFVETKAFKKLLSEGGESSVITLKSDTETKDILIHDVSYHPLSGEPLHADLLVIEKNKPIKVHVPFEFEGEAPAEKSLGGAVIKVMHELEIEALPKDLPQHITIDLSVLESLDSRITVADLKLPAGVTAVAGPEEVIVSVTEAGEEVKEEEGPIDLSAIELTEKKGKKEEEGEADEAGDESK